MKLSDCIRVLGFRLGWAYWMLNRKAMKNPQIIKNWARTCYYEAMNFPEDSPEYKAYKGWAGTLEKYLKDWEERKVR